MISALHWAQPSRPTPQETAQAFFFLHRTSLLMSCHPEALVFLNLSWISYSLITVIVKLCHHHLFKYFLELGGEQTIHKSIKISHRQFIHLFAMVKLYKEHNWKYFTYLCLEMSHQHVISYMADSGISDNIFGLLSLKYSWETVT